MWLLRYRSILDAAAELMQAEAIGEQPGMLARYLKPDLFILDDMGLKKLPAPACGASSIYWIMRAAILMDVESNCAMLALT
jgi:hypothetical protein